MLTLQAIPSYGVDAVTCILADDGTSKAIVGTIHFVTYPKYMQEHYDSKDFHMLEVLGETLTDHQFDTIDAAVRHAKHNYSNAICRYLQTL